MGAYDSFEVLVVPYFFVKQGHFFQHIVVELFHKQHMLPEGGNIVEHLKDAISIICLSEIVHAHKSRNVFFTVYVVFRL